MPKYDSTQDFAAKMDWEGGLYDFVVNYGVSEDELPDDMPGDIREVIVELITVGERYRVAEMRLLDLVEDAF